MSERLSGIPIASDARFKTGAVELHLPGTLIEIAILRSNRHWWLDN